MLYLLQKKPFIDSLVENSLINCTEKAVFSGLLCFVFDYLNTYEIICLRSSVRFIKVVVKLKCCVIESSVLIDQITTNNL